MLTGLVLPSFWMIMLAGIALDWLLGEPRRWHPLAGFGHWAAALERRINAGGRRCAKGTLAWLLAVAPPTLLACWLTVSLSRLHPLAGFATHAFLLYFSLGLRSLDEHVQPIAAALAGGDLSQARTLTARIVSRDTAQSDANDVAKAAVESLLENGNDAVFGALFWFAVAGGPGALLFRLANTLDAMWGYRTPRFTAFGRMAARTDDGLNLIPARLTAGCYALLGDTRRAWRCWRTQASAWASPNAGPVMASGAGALGLALGGAAVYDGMIEYRPPLGSGRAASADDIGRAWRLVAKTTVLWVVAFAAAGGLAFLCKGGLHA
jgi:adenosylcobinamide-phosphate synthase